MLFSVSSLSLALAMLMAVSSADIMVGQPCSMETTRATTSRVNNTAMLVGIVVGPETSVAGDLLQFRVLINNGDNTASVVDIRQASCCRDVSGRCQSWQTSTQSVVCHGIHISVDYRVTVIARAISSDSAGQVTEVLMPVKVRAGHIDGATADDTPMHKPEWDKFRAAALTTMVKKEVANISKRREIPSDNLVRLEAPRQPDSTRPSLSPKMIALIGSTAGLIMLAIVCTFIRRRMMMRSVKPSLIDLDAIRSTVEYVPL